MSLRNLSAKIKNDPEFIKYLLLSDISYHIKNLIVEKGLTKRQVLEKAGISNTTLSNLLSGEPVSIDTIAKVLSVLEEDIELIIKKKEKEIPGGKRGKLLIIVRGSKLPPSKKRRKKKNEKQPRGA